VSFAEPEHGATLGKYQLVARLGHGGMAEVFLAVARGPAGFNKLIVIKQLREALADDETFRSMFLDEARLAARLNHPNVVHTYEVGEADGSFFIAMEYLEGQPLNNLVKVSRAEGEPLSPAVSTRIIADALAGLHYAHELRDYDGSPLHIVHRDISPHNLFVTYDGQVKVVDFGIAKAASSSTETQAGILKGKAAYMAPEQARSRPVDRRSDVFAMGIVLWELCVGQRLMLRETTLATIQRLLSEPVLHPCDLVPAFPLPLGNVIMRALEHDPEDRFASADEMRGALSEWLATQPMRHDELPTRMRALFAKARAEVDRRVQACMASGASEMGQLARISLSVREGQSSLGSETPVSHSTAMTAASPTASPLGVAPLLRPAPTPTQAQPPRRRSGSRVMVATIAGGGALAAMAGAFLLRPSHSSSAQSVATPGSTVPSAVPAPKPEILLRLHGSNTIGAELAPILAEAYLKTQGVTDVRRVHAEGASGSVLVEGRREGKADGAIEISAMGSQTAFEDLAAHACDIGMSSRAIKPSEAERLAAAGLGDLTGAGSEHVLGLDGIAAIVHPNNSVRSLTIAQLRSAFDGESPDWSRLGGAPGAISLMARDDKSGTFDTWKHLVMGDASLAVSARRFVDSDKLTDAVASDPNALGFIGLAYVRSARALAVAEEDSLPLYPSRFTVASEDYPLSRRLFLYTSARPSTPAVLDFVSFALSAPGQKLVSDAGFVDLLVGLRDPEPCNAHCSAKYADLSKKARRLSLNFRFRPGSTALDTRGQRDIDRLLGFLTARPSPHIFLLGFSDGQGSAGENVELSKARAGVVADELFAHGVHAEAVIPFGAEMPVASNATEAGRERNRRVEVWLGND
jgi:phosphate binding protein